MTRTESLYLAISIVSSSNHPEKEQIMNGLQKCVHTLSQRKWNEENIFSACNAVYTEKGCLTASDLRRKDMPSHTDIAQVFRMSAKQFRDTYFPTKSGLPTSSPFCNRTVQEWALLFIEDYKRISPKTQDEYNKLRSPSLPTWNTVAKMHGLTSWNRLLVLLKLKKETSSIHNYQITCNLTKK